MDWPVYPPQKIIKNSEEIKSKTTNYKSAAFHLELFKGTYGPIFNVEKFCNLILIYLSYNYLFHNILALEYGACNLVL